MPDKDTLILALPNRLIFLLNENGRWFGRLESWSKGSGFRLSGKSPDTSRKESAQVYALRSLLGLAQAKAEQQNASSVWRPSSDVIKIRKPRDDETSHPCELPGCTLAPSLVVEFTDSALKPKGWPERRYFSKGGHIKAFVKKRGLEISELIQPLKL